MLFYFILEFQNQDIYLQLFWITLNDTFSFLKYKKIGEI
jgi:hypothetical protein